MCKLHQLKNTDTTSDSKREILNVALRYDAKRTRSNKPQTLRVTWAGL